MTEGLRFLPIVVMAKAESEMVKMLLLLSRLRDAILSAVRPRRARSATAAMLGAFALLAAGCTASRGGPIPYDPGTFAAPDAPSAITTASEYRIATGDTININVFQVEALSRDYRVDMAGAISMPLIGDVAAVGRTTQELGTEIAQRLGARYLRNPNVTVAVRESTNNNFTVEGGVRRPGMFPVPGRLSLIQAIAVGGGIDPQGGNPRRVAIFRQVQGQRMAAAFDMISIRRGEMQDPQVYAGDIIVVETNTRRGLFQDILQSLPVLALFRPF